MLSKYPFRVICAQCGDFFNTDQQGKAICDYCRDIRPPPAMRKRNNSAEQDPSFDNAVRFLEDGRECHVGFSGRW